MFDFDTTIAQFIMQHRQVLRQKAEKPDEFCNANQTQMRQGTSHECQRDSVKREEVAGDVCTVSTNLRTCTSKESEENAKDLLNSNKLLDNLRLA